MTAQHLRYAIYGLLMGFVLERIGFSSWAEVHAMFTFSDLRLLFTFALAVAISAAGFQLLARNHSIPPRAIHPGTIAGGAIFGAGWAISGACPAIVLVQLGEGKLLALYTLAGILAGTWLYARVHGRYFRWETASCES